ncbi:hypothetical protein BU25DRAFT_420979 [Macroventuria anomochaeta]|uniref:Uncharacterized protein n=1 Tax=Macroventuria anomochaeta TaxID=301207 RepID=A0ACB6S2L9_9PLEO|nr:uncharacterized protein BU25DRAFT_420979 [Macroventuria anomochaeta]KAF2628520.1 hypothetical protein BU25DRAFT_420979 [Macroventuria anomochaeta]
MNVGLDNLLQCRFRLYDPTLCLSHKLSLSLGLSYDLLLGLPKQSRGTQTTLPVQPAQLAPTSQPPAAAPAAAPTRNGTPYEHWPPHPWSSGLHLPDIGAGRLSLKSQDKFFNTKPHMSDEETHWHGAKFLGFGLLGAAGLWCETDEQSNVVDRNGLSRTMLPLPGEPGVTPRIGEIIFLKNYRCIDVLDRDEQQSRTHVSTL